MKQLLGLLLVAFLLGGVTRVWAQGGPPGGVGGTEITGPGSPGPPEFLSKVFPPKVVMEHQQEIGLRPSQADAIKQAMSETQQKLLDLQWRLDAESEALGKLLASDHVDEAAVLAKLDQVTSIEQQVKKVNFALLVRIKNQLDSDQQAKLRALRPAHPHGPPGPPPPPRD
jgi:Spy/CpxP family protein refolding chaperone